MIERTHLVGTLTKGELKAQESKWVGQTSDKAMSDSIE